MSNTKGALQSKAVWGAVITLVGAFGLMPLGVSYEPEAGNLVINVPTAIGIVSATGIGGTLSLVGRLVAKSPIRGLWG